MKHKPVGHRSSFLVDCRYVGNSGIGRYTVEMIRNLNKCDIDLYLLGNKETINKHFEFDKHIVEFDYPVLSISEQLGFIRLRRHFDVYWNPHINIPIFKSFAKKNICTFHDLTPFLGFFGWRQKLYLLIMIMILKFRGYIVIFDTNYVSRRLRFLSFRKQIVIPLAPKNIFCAKETIPNRNNCESINSDEQAYALCVGNLKPHKNLGMVISVWNDEPSISKKYKLKIVGSGGLRTTSKKQLIQQAISNENIEFLGNINDAELADLYRNASIFIMPSLSEGFGLPVLEAQASGTRVLCSNTSCLPEVGGDGCVYFNPRSEKELIRAIQNIELNRDLICLGKFNASKYSWKTSGQSLERLIFE